MMIDCNPECVMFQGQYSAIPLHNACRLGHFNVVKVLMEHRLLSKSHCRNQLRAMTRDYQQTPLHLAALYGHVRVVEFLLNACSRLKIKLASLRNKFGDQTPVHVAAFKGKFE